MDYLRRRLLFVNLHKKSLSNISWLAGDKIIRLIIAVVVSIWAARYFGPKNYGTYSYAIAFVSIFSSVAALGLQGIVVRELVRKKEEQGYIIRDVFFSRLLGGVVLCILSNLSIALLQPSGSIQRILVAILGSTFLFQSVEVFDLWFQSRVDSKWPVIAGDCSIIIGACLRIILILCGTSLVFFSFVTVLESVINAAVLFWIFRKRFDAPISFKPGIERSLSMLKESWPLIISSASVMLYMKLDQLMLGSMIGDREVGVYSVAVRISEVWFIVPTIIASTIFPQIVKSIENKIADDYNHLMMKYFILNVAIAYAVSIFFSLFSGKIIQILFGYDYVASGPILRVHIWSSVFVFLGVARGQYLVGHGFFKSSMISTIAGALLNMVLNLYWIPKMGGVGAAYASLISYAASGFLSSFLFPYTRHIGINQLRALLFPIDKIVDFTRLHS